MTTSFNCPNCDAVLIASVFNPSATGTPPPTSAPPPPPPPPAVPRFFDPFPLRHSIQTELPWNSAFGRIYSIAPLTDQNEWLIGVTTGADYTSGSFVMGEWQGLPWFRDLAIYRNRDGVKVYQLSTVQTPSVIFVPGIQPPRSSYAQLVPNERYTIAVTNHTPGGSSPMFGELHFR